MPEPASTPLSTARRRAGRAKVLVTIACGVGFAAAFGLSRASYASHAKHRAVPLAAPRSFVDTVHRDMLQGGTVAPPAAPPVTQTAES